MLLWFKDLMNVIEEVTIHRPNVSTLLSSALIRGDLNAATRSHRKELSISFTSLGDFFLRKKSFLIQITVPSNNVGCEPRSKVAPVRGSQWGSLLARRWKIIYPLGIKIYQL